MELTPPPHRCIWSSPIRSSSSSHHPLRVSTSPRKTKLVRSVPSFRSIRRRNLCSASSSETLVGSQKEGGGKEVQVVSKKGFLTKTNKGRGGHLGSGELGHGDKKEVEVGPPMVDAGVVVGEVMRAGESGDEGCEVGVERGTIRRLVSFIGDKIWGVWN